MSKIFKSDFVIGDTIKFRNVELNDAEYIYNLRVNPHKSRFITATPEGVINQITWIKEYEQSIDQAYFIIEKISDNSRIGTVRLYDPISYPTPSFSWGSWILSGTAPNHAAIESALMVYEYGFEYLGYNFSHFNVRRDNVSVCKFHERMGAMKNEEIN